jgi:hypothetical protein
LSPFVADVVGYIAGWVVRKVQLRLKCPDCMRCLVSKAAGDLSCSLIEVKNNGGLVVSSKDVMEIVKQAEKSLEVYTGCLSCKKIQLHGVFSLKCVYCNVFQEHCFKTIKSTLTKLLMV